MEHKKKGVDNILKIWDHVFHIIEITKEAIKWEIVADYKDGFIVRELYTDNYIIADQKTLTPCPEKKVEKKRFSYDWIDMSLALALGIVIWAGFIYLLMKW
jgi:hypothetical protein